MGRCCRWIMFEQKYWIEVNFEIISLLCSPSRSCQLSCPVHWCSLRRWKTLFVCGYLARVYLVRYWHNLEDRERLWVIFVCYTYVSVLDLMLRQIRGVVPVHDTFTFQTRGWSALDWAINCILQLIPNSFFEKGISFHWCLQRVSFYR